MSDIEDSGDFGYDLAHEVKTYLATPPSGHPVITPLTSGAHHDPEPDGDYGYDEAHEFR